MYKGRILARNLKYVWQVFRVFDTEQQAMQTIYTAHPLTGTLWRLLVSACVTLIAAAAATAGLV